jgi:hypothetical protein
MFLVDGSFASIVSLARKRTGKRISPRRIELTRRRAGEALLVRHFGCEVRFDAPIALLVLEESALLVCRQGNKKAVICPTADLRPQPRVSARLRR